MERASTARPSASRRASSFTFTRREGLEPFQVAAAGGHVDVLPKTPGYLEVELDKLRATLVRRPKRVEVPVTCDVQLVVEYYAAR